MDFKLDHFKLYDVQPYSPGGPTPLVQGQFDDVERPSLVGLLRQFANPVSKNGEAIIDPNRHFMIYDLQTTFFDPPRGVSIQNQFGEQDLVIDHVISFLVPARKIEPGLEFPDGLDHYKGYRIIGGASINQTVSLADQFEAEDGVAVLEPLVFCVPVTKRLGSQFHEINNPTDHLTIYRIAAKPYAIAKQAQDQFFPTPIWLDIFQSQALAVPSLKLDWGLAKEPPGS